MTMMMITAGPGTETAGMMTILLMLADRQTGRGSRTEFGSVGTWQIIYSLHDVTLSSSILSDRLISGGVTAAVAESDMATHTAVPGHQTLLSTTMAPSSPLICLMTEALFCLH